jgi:hypothetical protein
MNNTSDITIKTEIAEIKTQLSETINRVSRTEATIEQLNRSIASGNLMTLWQFLGFMLVMVGTLLGSMYWATNVLEKRFDERFMQMEKRFDERFVQMEKRFDERFIQMEKRFEDLKQVVLSRDK